MKLSFSSGWVLGQFLAIALGVSVGFWFLSVTLGIAVAFLLGLLVDIREELIVSRTLPPSTPGLCHTPALAEQPSAEQTRTCSKHCRAHALNEAALLVENASSEGTEEHQFKVAMLVCKLAKQIRELS